MSDEVENIWQGNQFGSQSSSALLHMVWFNNTIHFGLQARDEHRRFKFGDVEIKKKYIGEEREYATSSFERETKTHSSANESVHDRPFCPRMYMASQTCQKYQKVAVGL